MLNCRNGPARVGHGEDGLSYRFSYLCVSHSAGGYEAIETPVVLAASAFKKKKKQECAGSVHSNNLLQCV